jgi:hypothetical protein
MKGRVRLGRIAVLASLLFLLGAASIARAEPSASGNLFITFNGGIVPNALPRHDRAPITVWIAGKVRTLAGERPPALRMVTIALNRSGRLETKGLPTCRRGRIEATTSAEALKVCGDALVGSGTYRARSTFPEQARSPTFGKILAFNATTNGHPTILAHVHGTKPGSQHQHHPLPDPSNEGSLRDRPNRRLAGRADPLGLPEADHAAAPSQLRLPRPAAQLSLGALPGPGGPLGGDLPVRVVVLLPPR